MLILIHMLAFLEFDADKWRVAEELWRFDSRCGSFHGSNQSIVSREGLVGAQSETEKLHQFSGSAYKRRRTRKR